ncbi:MAG: class I SAM-dependent methyltransferase [Labilithrix sp.]|nr:class I SAM-dependent methyltransferase [Labilithrix sp.]
MNEPRPSVTAAVVAATLLLLRDDPELGHLVDRRSLDAIARSIREPLPGVGWALDRVPWPLLRRAALGLERVVSPGFVAHYALRKHMIRERLLAAIEDGHRQVVLVGAGFDMLSASVPDEARVFEVDLPATQAAKRRAHDFGREIVFVPLDLTRDSLRAALLASPGFDPGRDTVFVAEGLLMYLERPSVEAILADMTELEGRVRLVASVVTPDRRGRVRLHTQRAVVDLCMRLLGERFRWGESPERLEETLAAYGLDLETVSSTAELCGEAKGKRARRPTGEVIVVASGRGRASAVDALAVDVTTTNATSGAPGGPTPLAETGSPA